MKKHYRIENDCLNCGATLQGKFCHVCGQENLQIKESFGHMMEHAISDYFHFDHQFFSTLKPLAFKPGFLTNEYMAGKRMSYLHPVKMYIFISVVYFLLLFQTGQETKTTTNANPKQAGSSLMGNIKNKVLDSAKKEIDKDPDLKTLSPAQKNELKKKITNAQTISDYGVIRIADDSTGPNKWFHPTTKAVSYQQYLADQKKLPEEQKDDFVTRQWNKKVYNYIAEYGLHAKDSFAENFEHNVPKMMFVILPLFALILRVAFYKNKKYYVEHLIYAFHFHCFLFLFLGIIILLNMLIPHSWGVSPWLDAVAVFYTWWYIYRSFRVVYQRSRFRTITKQFGVGLMYFCAFFLCFGLFGLLSTII
jgi:Protein of unknown function (DUF3667)